MSTLFTHVTALLMDEQATTLTNGYVAVEGAHITYVGAQRPQGPFDQEIDCTGQVMLPGLVNAHTHIPMTLLRGYGGGHDLHTWLHQYIFPAEAKLDDRAVAAGAALGLAEMIASGVTCIADMYLRTHAIAQQVLQAGISANLSCGGVYFGDPDHFSPDACRDCHNQRALTQEWHGAGDGQILVDASIHGEYTSSAPLWQWMADWAMMAQKGVSCVHNPYSNLKLGSGIAPIPAMAKAGVNLCLGTDGMSSHNSADLFADIKLAAVLHNGAACDPMALSPRKALEMATVCGARALGRPTGQIVPGKAADLILVDFTAPNLTPCHDVTENLVFAAHGSNVTMNMARGKVIYQNGTFYTLDLERIRWEVAHYALPRIFEDRKG